MSLFFSRKSLAVAVFATAALAGATVAEARPEVYVSIGFESGPTWVQPAPVYVQPRPVYVQPRPVYVQPAPVYVRPPVFVRPCDVYGRPYRGGYGERHHWEREHGWRRDEWQRHERHDRHDGFRGNDRDPHGGGDGRGRRY